MYTHMSTRCGFGRGGICMCICYVADTEIPVQSRTLVNNSANNTYTNHIIEHAYTNDTNSNYDIRHL